MATQAEEQLDVKRYQIQYPLADYTFPSEARIETIHFDDEFLHFELTDGRKLAVPLRWIPTLYHASPEEREKYNLNPARTMVIWDPAKCAINDELRLIDYLAPAERGRP